MKHHIAIIIEQYFDPHAGGVEQVTSKLGCIFKDNGHSVILVSLAEIKKKIVQWNSINIYYLVGIASIKSELQAILESNNINILINQSGYSSSLTKLLIRNLSKNVKIINNLHINPLNFHDNHKFFVTDFLKKRRLSIFNSIITQKIILLYHIIKQRIELNYIIKNVDAFVMLSERFIPELFKLAPGLKEYENKIYCISNPIEFSGIEVKKLNKEKIILYVGRLNIAQKRVDLLLQIWKKLHIKLPDWQFWVVGDGPERKFMEDFCLENNMTNIKFWGQKKPEEFYKKANILHLTSAFEGFGLVLAEAQSFGCVPILFHSYSAAYDIVTHNENGILITPFNTDEYANATLDLINNTTKFNKLKSNTVKSVDRFSFENTYQKWENLFNILIDGN